MKPYRKPHITMNRKKYGNVRPVRKKKKEIKLERPKTIELRSIYSHLKKSATWQMPDRLSEAIQWHRRNSVYIYAHAEINEKVTALMKARWASLRQIANERDALLKTAQGKSFETKAAVLVKVIQKYEQEAIKLGAKIPLIKEHLKKAQKNARKFDLRKFNTEKKFDSLLGTFIAASGLNVDLGAVPGFRGGEAFHYDPNLHKLLYARETLKDLKHRVRTEGFLPVILEQIVYIARANAMQKEMKKTGTYLVNNADWVVAISQGLKNLCKWLSESQDAPNRLIKRTVPKVKRKRKVKATVSEPEDIHSVVAETLGIDRERAKGVNMGKLFSTSYGVPKFNTADEDRAEEKRIAAIEDEAARQQLEFGKD